MPPSCPNLVYRDNPVREIDMVRLAYERFEQHGVVIWPENQATYRTIARLVQHRDIHVAGAGIGWGANLLWARCARCTRRRYVATDRSAKHVAFCQQLYPHVPAHVWDVTRGTWPTVYRTVVAVEVLEHVQDQPAALRHLWASASDDVWLSTPNRLNPGLGQEHPMNPYHVHECVPDEVLAMAQRVGARVTIHHWQTGALLPADTIVTPLLYHLTHG